MLLDCLLSCVSIQMTKSVLSMGPHSVCVVNVRWETIYTIEFKLSAYYYACICMYYCLYFITRRPNFHHLPWFVSRPFLLIISFEVRKRFEAKADVAKMIGSPPNKHQSVFGWTFIYWCLTDIFFLHFIDFLLFVT